MPIKKGDTKTTEQVLAEQSAHNHKHDADLIKCTGKDCLGKEDHIMKPSGTNKIKCTDCGEERILVKQHEGLKECPYCHEHFSSRRMFDECPFCGKEV